MFREPVQFLLNCGSVEGNSQLKPPTLTSRALGVTNNHNVTKYSTVTSLARVILPMQKLSWRVKK